MIHVDVALQISAQLSSGPPIAAFQGSPYAVIGNCSAPHALVVQLGGGVDQANIKFGLVANLSLVITSYSVSHVMMLSPAASSEYCQFLKPGSLASLLLPAAGCAVTSKLTCQLALQSLHVECHHCHLCEGFAGAHLVCVFGLHGQYAQEWGPYFVHLSGLGQGVLVPTKSLGLGCFCPGNLAGCTQLPASSSAPSSPQGTLSPPQSTTDAPQLSAPASATSAPVNFTLQSATPEAPANGKQATTGVVVSMSHFMCPAHEA